MSVKRSRIARSSSNGEVVLSLHLSSPQASSDSPELRWGPPAAAPFSGSLSAATRAAKMESPWSCPGILSISSPATEKELGQEAPVGNFLERCFYCKKTIEEDHEVFMYGYLQAFCTPECRDKQILMDNLSRKLSGESSTVGNNRCKMKK